MALSYNLENESAVHALLNKQRDLIQEQTALIATQNSIITSLSHMLCDIQRYGYDRAHIGMLSNTIDHLEDELTEV